MDEDGRPRPAVGPGLWYCCAAHREREIAVRYQREFPSLYSKPEVWVPDDTGPMGY